ncbi:uncharacterized protein LOC127795367 isoform X3 [Diospyros lotus]|uniref:uncharacterized protein LOC127795367 isoform X1 n=1 Tax=Diospyros lotus TaxID=55363 RepID=UPI00224FAED8|nr:uncharacterized protein LOC127795367 isoform X1 [Diospyros lotus]XP_052182957.1 uncharacterized protein LOC127795367 isoform X2 [Diospyros lotus]XP_052182958.1 uncharacterized protein LOC127795367 isoform X3 [Diospyros lotus]
MGKACGSRARSGKVSGAPPTVAKEGRNKNPRGPRMKSTKYLGQVPLTNPNCASTWKEVKRALLAGIEKILELARSTQECATVEECEAVLAQIRSIGEEMKELILHGVPAEEFIQQPPV